MKKIVYIVCLITSSILSAQQKKEEIRISFNVQKDSLVIVNNEVTSIWIRNPLYEKQMATYNKNSKHSSDDNEKDKYKISSSKRKSVHPSEFYKFFILCNQVSRSACEELSKKEEFNRDKLGVLSSRDNKIWITGVNGYGQCYEVSFYENVVE